MREVPEAEQPRLPIRRVLALMLLLACYGGFYVAKARGCLLEKHAFASSVGVNRRLQQSFSVVYAPVVWLDESVTGREFPSEYTGAMPP